MVFAMFFLGEYCNMVAMSVLVIIFFIGGWLFPIIGQVISTEIILSAKSVFVAFSFIVARAMLPRYKYDQLMVIC